MQERYMSDKQTKYKDIKQVSTKVTNNMLYEKLESLEKRLLRIEKIVLLSVDDKFLQREERARVERIEQMIAAGKIDELFNLDTEQ